MLRAYTHLSIQAMAWHFCRGVAELGAVFVTEAGDWLDGAEERCPVEEGLITTMGLPAKTWFLFTSNALNTNQLLIMNLTSTCGGSAGGGDWCWLRLILL